MGNVCVVGEIPAILTVESADDLRNQLGNNAAQYRGVSNARDAMFLPMIDLVADAVFSSDDGQAAQQLFRRPFSQAHLRGRSTSDDARLFKSSLRHVFGFNDWATLPVIRDAIVSDTAGTPRRQVSWQSLAEIRTPTDSKVVCEGVFRRPISKPNSSRAMWVEHELVGIVAPVLRHRVVKSEARPVNLEIYDTLEVLPGDYGNWQSQLASIW